MFIRLEFFVVKGNKAGAVRVRPTWQQHQLQYYVSAHYIADYKHHVYYVVIHY